MGDPSPDEVTEARHLRSRLAAESLQSRELLRRTDARAVRRLLPRATVVKVGGRSIIDRGPEVLLPVISELCELAAERPLLITAGEGARARHVYEIASDLGLPTGMLATLGNSVSEQNALILSALMMDQGAVNVPIGLVPMLLGGGQPVVLSGMPPFEWWEPPPSAGRLPEHRSDAGTFLIAEAFGCRTVVFVKDQDGLYDDDPAVNPDAARIPEIGARELLDLDLSSLPLEPIVLRMAASARVVQELRIVSGLMPEAVTQALAGGTVGSVITTGV